jgi:hypothetical protein
MFAPVGAPCKKPHSLEGLRGSPDEVTQTLPELCTPNSTSKVSMQLFFASQDFD